MLRSKKKVIFSDLVPEGSSRLFIVVTLVALLEMAKGGEIRIEQNEFFSELWIAKKRLKPKSANHNETDQGEQKKDQPVENDSTG